MTKKLQTGGLEGLLGEYIAEKPKAGRPVTQTTEIDNESERGTLPGQIRATYIVRKDQVEKIKRLAYWESVKYKDIVIQAIDDLIGRYEKKNGELKEVPSDSSKIKY